ncbi:MAG: hypothetical protein HPY90_15090 [Syntrophothermus sp.]|nr:hypothetical protein [Syntrophothermus sp.]NSW84530.1 hypothetical protein [Syntrophothermus sp.]
MRFIKQPLPSDYYLDINNQAWYAEAALFCAINDLSDLKDGLKVQLFQ